MEWTALLFVAGMAVVAIAFIVRPLIVGQAREPSPGERQLSLLYAERDQTLALLQELDMDYAMGKLTPDDYQDQRAAYVRRGADILRQIDEVAPAAEAGVQAYVGPDSLEAQIAELRLRAAGFCTKCGKPLVVGDRFCSTCGEPAGGASV